MTDPGGGAASAPAATPPASHLTPTHSTAPRPAALPVFRTVLSNGLTLLVRRDRSAPAVAIVTFVKAGYFDEADDIVGIAHVLEHMFFKGTPSRGVGEIARETKASGGYLNAHTIYDHTSYYTVVPESRFGDALAIQADAYAHSLIDAAELAKEIEVIIPRRIHRARSRPRRCMPSSLITTGSGDGVWDDRTNSGRSLATASVGSIRISTVPAIP